MKTFDPSKPVQTKSGLEAEILCTDLAGEFPILATYVNKSGFKCLQTYTRAGAAVRNDSLDLVNIPQDFILKRIAREWAVPIRLSSEGVLSLSNFLTKLDKREARDLGNALLEWADHD